MDLQSKLIELSQYGVGCRIAQGYSLVNICYDDNWKIIRPQNELIEADMSDGVFYYCAPVDKVPLEEIFECVEATIEYNMDLKRKMDLFREKAEELQEIFAEEDLETLKSLKFTFPKKKGRKKKDVQEATDTVDGTTTKAEATSEVHEEGPIVEEEEELIPVTETFIQER